jgi:hypothetical protein
MHAGHESHLPSTGHFRCRETAYCTAGEPAEIEASQALQPDYRDSRQPLPAFLMRQPAISAASLGHAETRAIYSL